MDRLILIIGAAIILGSLGGRIFARFRIPQVVGYIVIGVLSILVGGTVFHAISAEDVKHLEPVSLVALAIIGFNIGGELKKEVFKKHGKGFIVVLLCEGITAAIFVSILTGLATCPWRMLQEYSLFEVIARGNWPLAILLGAIASATAPAATVDVLWEYRTRGMLTTTVLAIVALDDGLALLLYGFASTIADILISGNQFSLMTAVGTPLYHIFGSIALGSIIGGSLGLGLHKLNNREIVLPLCVGGLFAIIGLCYFLDLDLILAAMSNGAVLVNIAPRRSREAFDQVSKFAPPIFVLFFVLVGARLQFKTMTAWIFIIALTYVIGRTAGKFLGAYLGSKWAGLSKKVQRYLGFCLFSQAGVAIGLAILASQRFSHETAQSIIMVITASTFLVQIIGPPFVRFAVIRAGEVGKDITEEDLLASFTVGEVMDKKPSVLPQDAPLRHILQTAAESEALYYPVMDKNATLVGMISFLEIKNLFILEGLGNLVLAHDLMSDPPAVTTPDVQLTDAIEKMKEINVDVLPVVSSSNGNRLLGILEQRRIQQTLSKEIIRRRQEEI